MELQLLAVFEWRDVKKRQKGAQRVAILLRSPVSVRLYSYAYLLNNKCTVHKLCVSFSSTTFFSNSFPREKYLGKLRSKSAHTKIGTEQTTLL